MGCFSMRAASGKALRCVLLASVAALAPAAASAQSLNSMFGDRVDLAVGGIAVVKPVFEGSKKYEVVGIPFIAPAGAASGDGLIEVQGIDDFRIRALRYQGFEAGPLLGWRFGRQEDDADHLRGLGDVDGGLVLGAYAAYKIAGIRPYVSYHHQVTGDDTGFLVRFGADTSIPLNSWLTLTANSGATYASSSYMESFFGVTAAQSAMSHLAVFDAGAGIKDVFFELGTDIKLTEQLGLKLTGRYKRLIGDAADSPITETADQFQGVVAVTYKFSVPLK